METQREINRVSKSEPEPFVDQTLDVLYFQTFGFVVLHHFFDPGLIAPEIDRVMHQGLRNSVAASGGTETHFQYVPMMTAETPGSLWLLDRTEDVAVTLLGGSVLPTRAKGTRYWGNTAWHTDSDLPVPSIGVVAYLETLAESNGALRVLPGSHRPEFGSSLRALGTSGKSAAMLPAHVVTSEPGDLVVFDEHLFHGSFGGGTRRQWRVDYISAPVSAEAEDHVKTYFKELYRPDWDGGYDVDRYPSYGPDWRNSGRASIARLEALGVYQLAARQEAFARSRR